MNHEEERFASRKKALDWLKEQGHKVSTGKFYKNCKEGFPAVATDGSLSRYQVLTYGLSLSKQVLADPEKLSTREFDQRKAKADADIAEMKAKKMHREQDKLWLHADDAWSLVAGLTGKLRDSIRHQLYSSQRDVVQTAGGDQNRAQEVFEFMDQLVDRAFNEVVGESINVQFEREID